MEMSKFVELRMFSLMFIVGTVINIVQGNLGTILTENIALNKDAIQTDTESGAVASLSNDGDHSRYFSDGSCSRTLSDDASWEVDLGNNYTIGQVEIYSPLDCCSYHFRDVRLYAGTARDNYVLYAYTSGPAVSLLIWVPTEIITSRWIKIARALGQINPLTLCEVKIFELELHTTTSNAVTTQSNVVATTQSNVVTTQSNVATTQSNVVTTASNIVSTASDVLTTTVNSVATAGLQEIPVKSFLFKQNFQKRAVGEIVGTLSAKSKIHCCYSCLVSASSNECKNVNYNLVNGQCSLAKGTATEDNYDADIVMLTLIID